jgi:hypothetical protein
MEYEIQHLIASRVPVAESKFHETKITTSYLRNNF